MKTLVIVAFVILAVTFTIGQARKACIDEESDCPAWAERGDCKTSEWMREYCRRSCGSCEGSGLARCSDNESDCPGWAARGDCRTNSEWMSKNCGRSCRQC